MKKKYQIKRNKLYAYTDYSAVLTGGSFGKYTLERVELDEMEISDGTVCFFDPYNAGEAKPFLFAAPKKACRPFAMLVSTTQGKRVALAGLDFGFAARCKNWRLAFTGENDVLKLLGDADTFGIAVSSGFGALCDCKTLYDFRGLVKGGGSSFHPLDGAVDMDGSCARLCNLKGVRLPVFNTGWGEGNYRCYVGTNETGEVGGVICDFSVVKSQPRRDISGTEEFELDVSADELYVSDPKKSDTENNIVRCTSVIENADADLVSLFNAYARRGYAYHISQRYDDALGDYLKAIEIGRGLGNEMNFASHAWSLYDNAALIYREAGKTEEAIKLYEEAKSVSDTFYSGAFSGLIDIYKENKDYAKALEVADEMISVRPQDPSSYVKRSEIYMACEEYENAIADLDVLIDVYKLGESILDKAVCLAFLGRNKEALRVLDTYLLDGRASEVYYDVRAGIELADKNFSAAYSDALKAFDVNPDYLPTLEKLIELDSLLFNFRNVIKWSSRYIESCPRAEYGYGVRAEAYYHMHEYGDALSDYMYLTRHIKHSPRYYCLMIKTALEGGNRGVFKKYAPLLRKTDNAYYIYLLGLDFFYHKKYARAERYLASAFALREDEMILSSLIECLIESEKFEKAAAALKTLERISDSEEAYVLSARLAKAYGADTGEIIAKYMEKFLNGCEDVGFFEKVSAFFENLQ